MSLRAYLSPMTAREIMLLGPEAVARCERVISEHRIWGFDPPGGRELTADEIDQIKNSRESILAISARLRIGYRRAKRIREAA